MTMLIIQSLLLLAIAYILGCILGCVFRRWFGSPAAAVAPAAAVTTASVAAAAMAPKAAPKPAAAKAVAKPKPPVKPKPAAAKAKPAPRKRVAAKPKAAPASAKDDLKRIRGIGPQNEARLNTHGVMTFAHVAGWSKKDQADMGERLSFPGRIEREEWVKQAKILAKGGNTQFSKRVDKGEVTSSTGKVAKGDVGKKPRLMAKAPAGGGDNLTLIDGVGNALEKKLFALGVHKFSQIAKWTNDNETWIGNELGFPGRPERENWVAEAKILADGGMTDHAKRVERGEITTSRKTKI